MAAADQLRNPEFVVLVVDDDEILRNEVVTYLQKLKIGAMGFASGNQALVGIDERAQKYGAPKVSLIIADWMMDDGNGIELISKVRARADLANIACVLMSGAVSKEQLQGALSAGPDGILLKPFGMQILPERMRAAIEHRERLELEQLLKIDPEAM